MNEAQKYYPNINPKYNLRGGSAFGDPDGKTLGLIDRLHGKVLEVGAGDGRYTHPMLDRNLEVVAGDIDKAALDVLVAKTPEKQIANLQPVIFDAFEPFPFPEKKFDAVVSTAFLYLFPQEYIRSFMEEADRVTKSDGVVLIDFVADRERIDGNGNKIVGESEVEYSLNMGRRVLQNAVRGIFTSPDIQLSDVDQDLMETAGYRMKGTKMSVLFEKQKLYV